jgi:hypothetical protein
VTSSLQVPSAAGRVTAAASRFKYDDTLEVA